MKAAQKSVGLMRNWAIAIMSALCMMTLAPAGMAQGFGWIRQAPTLTSNDLYTVAFNSPTHGFVGGVGRVLMETFDGGRTWITRDIQIHGEPYYSIFFFNATHGWITGNGNWAFRTTDGGATWQRMTTVPAGSWWHIKFLTPTIGFIGANGACAFTADGGISWELRSGYPTCPVIYGMDFRDVNVGLVGGNQLSGGGPGIYKTTDGGRTWQRRYPYSANDVVFLNNDTVLAASGRSIVRSDDAGENWWTVVPQIDDEDGIGDMARVNETTIVGVGAFGNVWRSTDCGFTWHHVLEGIGDLPASWAISFLDEQHGWIVGPHGMLYATSDGGLTWHYLPNGIGVELYDIEMANERLGFAVGNNGYLLRTTNGGKRWELQRLKVTGLVFGRRETLEAVSVLNEQVAFTGGQGGIAFKTLDGGQTWLSIGYPALPGSFQLLDLYFIDENEGWAVGRDDDLGHYRTIYHTTNGGETWELSIPFQSATSYYGVCFVDRQHGWIVGPRSYLLRTEDGGRSWQRVNLPYGNLTNLFFTDVQFANANVGWMVGTLGFVLRSVDGGRTWQPQAISSEETIADIVVLSANEAWICSITGGLWHTTDGGVTWEPETSGYRGWTDSLSAIAAMPSGKVWGVGFAGTIIARLPGETVHPSSFTVTHGAREYGGLSTLLDSDDFQMILGSRRPAFSGDPDARIVLEGTASIRNPSKLTFKLEGRANGGGMRRMELYNFATNQWVLVDERGAPTEFEDVVEGIIHTNATEFVEQATGRVRARMSWYRMAPPDPDWYMWIDYCVWTLLAPEVDGDVNSDGCVDDADLLQVLFAFGNSGSGLPEDVNTDGVVDDADLLMVLFNFGQGC